MAVWGPLAPRKENPGRSLQGTQHCPPGWGAELVGRGRGSGPGFIPPPPRHLLGPAGAPSGAAHPLTKNSSAKHKTSTSPSMQATSPKDTARVFVLEKKEKPKFEGTLCPGHAPHPQHLSQRGTLHTVVRLPHEQHTSPGSNAPHFWAQYTRNKWLHSLYTPAQQAHKHTQTCSLFRLP